MSRYDDYDSPAAMDDFPWALYLLADAAVMLLDEEQRSKKGKSKAVFEDEEEEQVYHQKIALFDHFPRKKRSWVRHPQQHYDQNPNGASTSSTLPHFRSFKSIDCYPNSQSSQSSCLTETTTSRKRRALEMPQRKISKISKHKKAKVAPFSPAAARETPECLVHMMRDMNGSQDPRLIFERSLSTSDVNTGQSRLLIPFNMLTRNDFLTPAEFLAVRGEDGVGTILVNKWSERWEMRFKRWSMKKKSGNGTLNYVLNKGWNAFVKDNGLKANDEISLWSFRCCGDLCFALEHRPKSSI